MNFVKRGLYDGMISFDFGMLYVIVNMFFFVVFKENNNVYIRKKVRIYNIIVNDLKKCFKWCLYIYCFIEISKMKYDLIRK